MKEIRLSRGQIALVDEEDYESVSKHKWYMGKVGYPETSIDRKIVTLHRFLLPKREGKIIDHINNNPLDNRRSNLRYVTHAQNNANGRLPKDNTSGYKGVCYDKRSGKWLSRIGLNGKAVHIGYYKEKEDAALAYNTAAIKFYGDYAHLNLV